MYKEIDELIEAICVDEIFQQYLQSEKKLHDEKIKKTFTYDFSCNFTNCLQQKH